MDAYFVAITDAFFFGQRHANLDERCGLCDCVTQGVLCPEVMVLGQAISSRRIGVLILGTKGLPDIVVHTCGRVASGQLVVRVEWVKAKWTLEGLVVLGERAINHACREQTGNPFGVHNEWPNVFLGSRIWTHIGDISTPRPSATPSKVGALGIPWLTAGVSAGPVIKHTTVGRPSKAPLGINTSSAGIVLATTFCHIANLGPAARVNPVTTGGRAIVL